jgi:coproporphyrinogen III oxidase-like Fe-S oxidoreductase
MEKKQRAQYTSARELLLTNGYIQYTTDNFYRKEAAKCKYLEATWKGPLKDTLALGALGFGWADEFYSKPFNVKKYIECIENKIEPFWIMNLTPEENFYGRAFFGLHGISVDRTKFKERNGRDLAECELIKVLQSLNMLRIEKDEVRLTEDGLYGYTELWGRATFLELMDEQEIV